MINGVLQVGSFYTRSHSPIHHVQIWKQKKKYQDFFLAAADVLPCKVCRKHLLQNFSTLPIQLGSTRELSEWLVNIHNEVNLNNKKPTWSYADAVKAYLPPEQYHLVNLTDQERLQIKSIPSMETQPATTGCTVNSIILYVIIAVLVCGLIALFICYVLKCCGKNKVSTKYVSF